MGSKIHHTAQRQAIAPAIQALNSHCWEYIVPPNMVAKMGPNQSEFFLTIDTQRETDIVFLNFEWELVMQTLSVKKYRAVVQPLNEMNYIKKPQLLSWGFLFRFKNFSETKLACFKTHSSFQRIHGVQVGHVVRNQYHQ